jgi:uncharacterized protein (DUF433 family)
MDNPTISVPLRMDEHGGIRVGGTRVLLEVMLSGYIYHGDTPEQIKEDFPTLNLADIHAVISYYLNNKDEVDAYLRGREQEATKLRHRMEQEHPEMFVLQNELRQRLAKSEK